MRRLPFVACDRPAMLEFDLTKTYGAFSLKLAAAIESEWLVLLAPSGGGKRLTLDLLAGVVGPAAGEARPHRGRPPRGRGGGAGPGGGRGRGPPGRTRAPGCGGSRFRRWTGASASSCSAT